MNYGIEEGQVWRAADGSEHRVRVMDTTTFAHCDDVVVKDLATGEERRIDTFKLARVRYFLEQES